MKKLFNNFHDYLYKRLNRNLDVRDFITIIAIIGLFSVPNPFIHIGVWFLSLYVIFDW